MVLCRESLAWQTDRFKIFGKSVPAPRRTAWVGSAGTCYRYTGLVRVASGWPDFLRGVRDRVAETCDVPFNFALANRYRDGSEYVGWHADDERDLGSDPVIASLSLGAPRRFCMRARQRVVGAPAAMDLVLQAGSLIVMGPGAQRHFQHAVPATRRRVGDRINLSFRFVRSS